MIVQKVFFIIGIFWLSLNSSVLASHQISLDFVEIKTRDLLKILAEHANKNIIISEKVNGKITVSLHNVSWREAIDIVLKMQGLVKQETDSVLLITTLTELSNHEQSALPLAVFNPHYISADNFSKLLKPAGVLSNQGKSGADGGSNSLVVADTSEHLATVRQLLKQIDVPLKQVLIEARIVSADESFARALGLEINGKTGTAINVNNGKIQVKENTLSPGQYKFTIVKFNNNDLLDLQLSALENEGRGKVISKPKLVTIDRQTAYIEAGAEVPYQEKTKEGSTSTSFKKAALSLKVTPEIVAKNLINLSLQLSQDKVGQLVVNGVPTIDTRKINTRVLVRDNETIVLGGIYEWSRVSHEICVPILGHIPLIKFLFSKKEHRMEKKELLIFVTPKIVS